MPVSGQVRQTPSFRQLFSFNKINGVSGANKSLFSFILYINLNLFQFWKSFSKGLPCAKKTKRQVEKDEDCSYSQKLSPRGWEGPFPAQKGSAGGGVTGRARLKLAASGEQDELAEATAAGTLQ